MRIARVYLDCDLRCGFEGLAKLAAKDVKINSLGKGDITIFLNRRATGFKLLAGKEYLTYFKNGNKRIPLEAIQHLPLFFDGQSFDFSKAVEKSIKDKLKIE